MKAEYIFPALLMAIDIGAAVVYALKSDWRLFSYYALSAAFPAVVSFWK